jgi:hypothetical protein
MLTLFVACGGGGGGSSSNNSNVNSAPVITKQPGSLTVNLGSSASFRVAASGSPTPTFTWDRSNDNGNTWNNIGGATNATYSFTSAKTDNLAQFQALAANSVGSTTSDAVTLTVQWLILTSQPVGQVVTAPSPAIFTVVADANPNPSYQWQSSPDGVTWVNVAGANENSYTTAATSGSNNGTQFQCIVTNPAGTVTSNPAILNVNQSLAAPLFVTQPINQTVHSGDAASFIVSASGTPSPNFTWQRSNDGGNTWANINGATSKTYTIIPQFIDNGAMFQSIAINSVGQAISESAMLNVTPSIYAGGFTTTWPSSSNLPGYWKNSNWVSLPPPIYGASWAVNTLALSGNDIYAAGNYDLPGYWLNGSWVTLTLPVGATSGSVNTIAVTGNDVYAAGVISGTGIGQIGGYWLNGNWISMGGSGSILGLAISGNDVFGISAGGYYKNGVWVSLPIPVGSQGNSSTCIFVSGSDIYIGGYVINSSDIYVPGYWLNGIWTSLPVPDGESGKVNAILISGNNIYAGGWIISPPGIQVAGYWQNGIWVAPQDQFGSYYGMDGEINSLFIFDNNLYVAGSSGSENNWMLYYGYACYWVNSKWYPLSFSSTIDEYLVSNIFSIVVN